MLFLVENGPSKTFFDKENMILTTVEGTKIDLSNLKKVLVKRTSGEWTPGWILSEDWNGDLHILLEEKSLYQGKVRYKYVSPDMIKPIEQEGKQNE